MVALAATVPNPPPVVERVICVLQSEFEVHVEAEGAVSVNDSACVPAGLPDPNDAGETELQDHPVHTNPAEQLTEADWAAPVPESHVVLQLIVTVWVGLRWTELGQVTDSAALTGVTNDGRKAKAVRTRHPTSSIFSGFIAVLISGSINKASELENHRHESRIHVVPALFRP
jgi:hypothetical protein